MCAKDLEERNIALNEDDDDATPWDSGLDSESDNTPTDDDDEIPSNRYLNYFNQFNCCRDRPDENFDPAQNAALAFTDFTEDCVDQYDLLTSNKEGAQKI